MNRSEGGSSAVAPSSQASPLDDRRVRLRRAFGLVCPYERAKRLAARGLLPVDVAARTSWKGAIQALVTDRELEQMRVTIDDVIAAIEFYTATRATATRKSSSRAFFVEADGYAAGPAGG